MISGYKMQRVTIIIVILLAIASCLYAKKFPDSFRFGAAGASYQIEGAWNEDGKGPSMWDTFSHTPGKIKNNDTGDIACDSYHKYKEDVQILKDLGVTLYRFSISWPRIFPNGTRNVINQAGIDYYLNLIKELKSNGIEPLVTLYHWDLPQHFSELGGWLNPEISDFFADYARLAFESFGSYVKYWVTLNEPSTTCMAGYSSGVHAPGLLLPGDGVYQCYYVHLLSHAKAYRIYDKEFRATQGGKVTINIASSWFYAKTNSPLALEAQKRALEFNLGIYADPVFKGSWPELVVNRVGNRSISEGYSFSRLPVFTQEEVDLINGTYDYFSLNVYTSSIVEYLPDVVIGTPLFSSDQGIVSSVDPSWSTSASAWLFSDPPGVRHLLKYVKDTYNPSEIVITENGWSDLGDVDDQGRITYLKGYLSNILDAILDDGINVTGYTLWSLMDNFEWAEGYTQKFGIVKVDFDSPNRTRSYKSSAEWYKKVIAARELIN